MLDVDLDVPGATNYHLDPFFMSSYPVFLPSSGAELPTLRKLQHHDDIMSMLLEVEILNYILLWMFDLTKRPSVAI